MFSSGGEIDNGVDYASVGAGSRWEISVLSSQICCEGKTALKKLS